MSIFSNLARSVLPEIFYDAIWGGDVQPNQPAYFLKQEHFDAIDEIKAVRKGAIKKQGKSFDDLESDLTIVEASLFGDIQAEGKGDIKRAKQAMVNSLKNASEQEQRDFLQVVYNAFNHGRFDEKPAFVKWVTSGNTGFASIMEDVRKNQELLATHSVSIVASHQLSDPSSAKSKIIRDAIELIGLVSGFVESTAGARTELNKGFGRLFKIKTDAAQISACEGQMFKDEFDQYMDGLIPRLEKIHGSKADIDDPGKWQQRLDRVDVLIDEIKQKQQAIMAALPQGPAPDVDASFE